MDPNLDQDRELFGDDLIQAAQRWAQPVVDRKVEQLQREIADLKRQNEAARVTAAQAKVVAYLDGDAQLAGNWRRTNEATDFLRWLDAPEELSGQRRLDLLRSAFNAGNGDRVAFIFKSYLASTIPSRTRTSERLPFEAPGSKPARQAPTHDKRGRRMWRRAEIAQFYRDVAAGRYDGRDVEKLRTEADIVAAPREGRIVDPDNSVTLSK